MRQAGVGLELHAELSVDEVEPQFVGAVAHGECSDEVVEQRRLAGAGHRTEDAVHARSLLPPVGAEPHVQLLARAMSTNGRADQLLTGLLPPMRFRQIVQVIPRNGQVTRWHRFQAGEDRILQGGRGRFVEHERATHLTELHLRVGHVDDHCVLQAIPVDVTERLAFTVLVHVGDHIHAGLRTGTSNSLQCLDGTQVVAVGEVGHEHEVVVLGRAHLVGNVLERRTTRIKIGAHDALDFASDLIKIATNITGGHRYSRHVAGHRKRQAVAGRVKQRVASLLREHGHGADHQRLHECGGLTMLALTLTGQHDGPSPADKRHHQRCVKHVARHALAQAADAKFIRRHLAACRP